MCQLYYSNFSRNYLRKPTLLMHSLNSFHFFHCLVAVDGFVACAIEWNEEWALPKILIGRFQEAMMMLLPLVPNFFINSLRFHSVSLGEDVNDEPTSFRLSYKQFSTCKEKCRARMKWERRDKNELNINWYEFKFIIFFLISTGKWRKVITQ